MNEKSVQYNADSLQDMIFTVRGQRVILDADLAHIYGVPTKRLNEQVRRNADRFPPDFLIQLTPSEAKEILGLRSQFATLKRGQHIKYLPHAFTEHGAIMAANVLNSPQATQMSVFVVRAFVRMRALLGDTRELARRLADLERELKERLDVHEVAIVSILQRVMDLIDPPAAPEFQPKPRKKIGFEVKEPRARYGRLRRGTVK